MREIRCRDLGFGEKSPFFLPFQSVEKIISTWINCQGKLELAGQKSEKIGGELTGSSLSFGNSPSLKGFYNFGAGKRIPPKMRYARIRVQRTLKS
jgi:hypothetical protein